MEGHCSTGQSPEWAVVPMEKEEEGSYPEPIHRVHTCKSDQHYPILTFSSTFFLSGPFAPDILFIVSHLISSS